MGSSLVLCQSLLFHNATHAGVMRSKMIPDLFQTVTTAGVSIEDRLVSSTKAGLTHNAASGGKFDPKRLKTKE